jgi:uncharacterized protein (DUF983 family)
MNKVVKTIRGEIELLESLRCPKCNSGQTYTRLDKSRVCKRCGWQGK